jgi:hypothetical protein
MSRVFIKNAFYFIPFEKVFTANKLSERKVNELILSVTLIYKTKKKHENMLNFCKNMLKYKF